MSTSPVIQRPQYDVDAQNAAVEEIARQFKTRFPDRVRELGAALHILGLAAAAAADSEKTFPLPKGRTPAGGDAYVAYRDAVHRHNWSTRTATSLSEAYFDLQRIGEAVDRLPDEERL